jgi:hypothetical protein
MEEDFEGWIGKDMEGSRLVETEENHTIPGYI